jgi:S1-C subfamily serine protease
VNRSHPTRRLQLRPSPARLRFALRAVFVLAILIGAIVLLNLQNHDLERRVVLEQERVAGLADLLRRLEGQAPTRAELDSLLGELSKGLLDAGQRVSALEAGAAAANQVIARASGSIVLVQGSFGVRDPVTKRPLRFALDKFGRPIRTPDGRAAMTLEGNGPPVESRFVGTAFVVDREGVLLTNRHVARPWEGEPAVTATRSLGLEPAIYRLRGYLPGANEPFELSLVGVSDSHDVALLQGEGAARGAQPLVLSREAPSPGDTATRRS